MKKKFFIYLLSNQQIGKECIVRIFYIFKILFKPGMQYASEFKENESNTVDWARKCRQKNKVKVVRNELGKK